MVSYSYKEMQSLHVAVNDAIRKIFSYNRWESIKTLRESLGYFSVTEIFAHRKCCFESKLSHIGNSVLSFLHKLKYLTLTLVYRCLLLLYDLCLHVKHE